MPLPRFIEIDGRRYWGSSSSGTESSIETVWVTWTLIPARGSPQKTYVLYGQSKCQGGRRYQRRPACINSCIYLWPDNLICGPDVQTAYYRPV